MTQKQFKGFFWGKVVPKIYPLLKAYHKDLVVHDRESLKRLSESHEKWYVWIAVGNKGYGTHYIKPHYRRRYLEPTVRGLKMFKVDLIKREISETTWDDVSQELYF